LRRRLALKVDDAANFVFVQLIEQEPCIYDKIHPDYARRDKIDLDWERISHETKEFVGVSVYSLSLLGKNSVKTFLRQQRTVEGVVFCAVRVVSKESGQFFLSRTSC
jgi:hypothetical protein